MTKRIILSLPREPGRLGLAAQGWGHLSPDAHNQSVMARNAWVWELTASEFETHGPQYFIRERESHDAVPSHDGST